MGIPIEIEDTAFEFYKKLSRLTYRISCKNSEEEGQGTGFVVAHYNNRLVLATAKHVLQQKARNRGIPLQRTWTVRRYDQANKVDREFNFQTIASFGGFRADPAAAVFLHHKSNDVSFAILPSVLSDGAPFTADGEDDGPLPFLNPTKIMAPTNELHWMGYPGTIERLLGHPQLMSYRGYIGAVINREDRHLYVVDGHVAGGVSGGPVWCYHSIAGAVPHAIVGIVCGYEPGDIERFSMPGYCIFEPFNEPAQILLRLRDEVDKANKKP